MLYKKILATGITGAGASEALGNFVAARAIRHIDFGKRIAQVAREAGTALTEDNVLQAPPDTLKILEQSAMALVERELQETDRWQGTIIDAHLTFLQTTGLTEGFSFEHVKTLGPDAFVTIIDGPGTIHKRIKERPRQYFQLSISDIIKWQELEMYLTSLFARLMNKPHIAVPYSEAEAVLNNYLIKGLPKVYASYPMTNLPAAALPRREAFVNELRRRFTLFNPAAIESAHDRQPFYSFEDHTAIGSHTIIRDLNWFIKTNDADVVAYMLPNVFSSGSNDELRFAYEIGKMAYVVYDTLPGTSQEPPKDIGSLSPFTTYKALVFRSPTDFFEFWDLDKHARTAYTVCLRIMHVFRNPESADNTIEEFRKLCMRELEYHLPKDVFSIVKGSICKITSSIYKSWAPQTWGHQ